jgi:hypothetical protein
LAVLTCPAHCTRFAALLAVLPQLLAKMGFKGTGHGLGRRQQGIDRALQAVALRRGAGLGVDGGSGIGQGVLVPHSAMAKVDGM